MEEEVLEETEDSGSEHTLDDIYDKLEDVIEILTKQL